MKEQEKTISNLLNGNQTSKAEIKQDKEIRDKVRYEKESLDFLWILFFSYSIMPKNYGIKSDKMYKQVLFQILAN